MTQLTRRDFLRVSAAGVGLGAGAALGGCAAPAKGDLARKSGRRVVVVGGGWGGATAAKYVRLQDPSIEVILLEPNRHLRLVPLQQPRTERGRDDGRDHHRLRAAACPRRQDPSRGGHRHRARHQACPHRRGLSRVRPRHRVARRGLRVGPGRRASRARRRASSTRGRRGRRRSSWPSASRRCPDGGVVVMTVPPVAYRCPPGPYERACQIAWFLQTKKPRAKLVVLDANNDVVSKTGLFKAVFRSYPNLEYRPTSRLERVDLGGARGRPGHRRPRAVRRAQSHPPPAGRGHRARGRAGRCQQPVVRGEPRHLRVGEAAGGARDRRRHHRPAGAEIRQHRERHGQDLRDGDRPPAERQGAPGARAGQHLLQLDQRSRGHRGRQRLPDRQRQGRPDRAEADPAPGGRRWRRTRSRGARASGTTSLAERTEGRCGHWYACSAWSRERCLLVAAPAAAGPLDGPGAQKALVCSACHGFAGNSRGDTMPILAGVDAAYFKKAIADYASGRRPSPEMEPYAKMVIHFGRRRHRRLLRGPDAASRRRSAPTRRPSSAVAWPPPPCVVCHGADGKGDRAKLIPDLSGPAAGLPPEPAPALQAGPAEPRGRRAQGGEAPDPDAARGHAGGPGRLLLEPALIGPRRPVPARDASARRGRTAPRGPRGRPPPWRRMPSGCPAPGWRSSSAPG